MTFRTIDTDLNAMGATTGFTDTPNAVLATRRMRSRSTRRTCGGGVRFVGLGI